MFHLDRIEVEEKKYLSHINKLFFVLKKKRREKLERKNIIY